MHSVSIEHATLAGFLTGTLSPEILADEVTVEVNACNAAFQAGENGYIIITEGPVVEVTREGARRLLAAIVEERLTFELANYVADCLIMNDDFHFADDAVRDAIQLIDDRPLSEDVIRYFAEKGAAALERCRGA
jgi:hypothetical protein